MHASKINPYQSSFASGERSQCPLPGTSQYVTVCVSERSFTNLSECFSLLTERSLSQCATKYGMSGIFWARCRGEDVFIASSSGIP